MSLDKFRIPKLSDRSRKFIQEKQRKAMNDPLWKGLHEPGPTKGRKGQAEWLKRGVKSPQKDKRQS